MTISRYKFCAYVEFFFIVLASAVNLQAQNDVGKPGVVLSPGNQRITIANNGDILSVSESEHISAANNANDTIIVSYSDVSVDVNRDISVWKGDYFPSVFYFPIDKHLLMRDYRNNAIMLNMLDELATSEQVAESLETIEIIGACSPIGSEGYNMKLALSRCMALRSYLRKEHLQFSESVPIKFNIIGVDKLGYRILKEQDPSFTEKQIWDRLQYAAIRLKMKDGSYIIPGSNNQKPAHSISSKIEETPQSIRDTVFLKCDTVYIMTTQEVHAEEVAKKVPAPVYVALKTNLLYDAALLPNLTAEWYIGKQWSLAVEGNWSWWTFDRPVQNQWHHRIQAAGIELRHWFKSPYPLHGHALGVYSMIGNYDVRLFPKDEYSKGYLSHQSWSAGLSYAYSFPIARKFNMELGLAVGYVGGKHYKYDYCMEHERWAQRNAYNRSYIGPTRVSVSLVWLLGAGNDEKSRDKYAARQKQRQEQIYGFQK